MHKRKDELRDIYQSGERDFEKDFTPQIAQEQIESRQRDLRRTRVATLFFGILSVSLFIVLIALVTRDLLGKRTLPRPVRSEEEVYIPPATASSDVLWVMDCQDAPSIEKNEAPTNRLSAKRVKAAAYHTITGQQFLTLNQTPEALGHFQKVVDIFPDIEGLHRAMGQLYLQQGEYAAAADHLEKALKEEESFDTVNSLGAAYLGVKKYDLAEKFLKRAAELAPGNPECHKNLAVLYREMARDNEAVFHFEKYLDLRPNDLNTLQTYTLYLTQLERWKDAANLLTKLTQDISDVAPLYFLLAKAQIQTGQQEKALEALKRGVQLIDPELALTWINRDEFSTLRSSGEFKSLVARLQPAPNPTEKNQP